MDSIFAEDLTLISAICQGFQINFGNFMIGKIQFIFEKAVKQKLLSIKQAISLPYKKLICKILVALGLSTQGLQVLPTTEGPMDHVLLLHAHFCLHQGDWVCASSLTSQ